MYILVIEDDIQLNRSITHYCKLKNNHVISSFNGIDAIQIIDRNRFDLYIIDIILPGIDGLEILKYIRQKDLKSPIIIITSSQNIDHLKIAFQYGCNDYLKKPFALEELEIRIDKCFSSNKLSNRVIQISHNITFDIYLNELMIDEEKIRLRKKEKRLLSILLANINQTVMISEIENYVWENEIKDKYPLRQLVNDLRKRFNTGEKFIFADKGQGYRFEIKN